ncbi:MAG TPA: hypothetical protein VGS03_15325 [Candidatus Polarisedimenticolia bacterium]|nr:hypothetical protein [Candidatus Polarisedimenticolia bacterium]
MFTFHGKPVASINTAFRSMVTDAGLDRDVTFHVPCRADTG